MTDEQRLRDKYGVSPHLFLDPVQVKQLGRLDSLVHDDDCESEWVYEVSAYTPCHCDDRAHCHYCGKKQEKCRADKWGSCCPECHCRPSLPNTDEEF